MSEKIKDAKNRWRSKSVGFRVSPEEWEEINRLVRLSGMSKQDYIMHKLTNQEMIVHTNPRVVKALREEIVALCELLERYQTAQLREEIDRRHMQNDKQYHVAAHATSTSMNVKSHSVEDAQLFERLVTIMQILDPTHLIQQTYK